jgi:glycosyltransferase involved in cell wall biosynthesis
MLFSVIIPLYNKVAYIESALLSVLDQRQQDLEVIVIDDGSTDDGARRVEAIDDSRLRLIRQSNLGVSAARNRGIREATGEYVAFLDADDYWDPGYLCAIADMIQQFPGCGMYATHFYWFHQNGFRQVDKLWRIPGAHPRRIDRFFEFWGHTNLFCTCSVVIPARVLRDYGINFPEGEQLGEDQDVWFRIGERWPVAYLPQPLVGYRVGVPDSSTTSYTGEVLPYIKRLRMRYTAGAIPSQHRSGVRRLIGLHPINIARILLLRGERIRAMKLLRDPLCLLAPRYWLRVFLAACMPASIGRRLIRLPKDRYRA